MKKVLKALIIILYIILLKFVFTFTINEIVKFNFNHGRYNSRLVKSLYVFNTNEKYIAYYNDGNIAFKKHEYGRAFNLYDDALLHNPPEKRVCDIRINMALSLVYEIDPNDKENINAELENAKQNLYIDGCANPDNNNGKSKDAEKLEEEIKKLQEELKKDSNSSDDNNDDNQNNEDDDKDTSEIEKKLKEIEKEARGARESDMNDTEYIGNYKYYNGKRW